MTWPNVLVVLIGAVVAIVGGAWNSSALFALGGTIVGGVLGNAVPNRTGAMPAGATTAHRTRRRRVTPPGGVDQTIRSRIVLPPRE